MAETIFDSLKQDHDRHRDLLRRIDGAAGEERGRLFEEFRLEVTAHAAAEEETLYATMLAKPTLRHDATHSVAEHKEIGDYFEDMRPLDPASTDWAEKFAEIRYRYEHHIGEEEEEMFPAAEEGLSADKVAALGDLFAERKPAERQRAELGCDEGDERD